MERVEFLLTAITVMLIAISGQIASINKRLKQRFPTEKEEDSSWAKQDPAGHWEAHKRDYK